MAQLAQWLLSIDPKLWDLAAAGAVWLVTWLWRRYLPSIWAAANAKNPALSQLWLTVLGGLISAAPSVGRPMGSFIESLLVGAVLTTLGAQGFHAALKALPGPYNGAEKRVEAAFVKRNTPPGGYASLDRPPPAESTVTPLDRPPPSGPSAKT